MTNKRVWLGYFELKKIYQNLFRKSSIFFVIVFQKQLNTVVFFI